MLNLPDTAKVMRLVATIDTPLAKSVVLSGTGVATFWGRDTVVVS